MDSTGLIILAGTWETLYMVLVAGFFATLFGLPMGVLLWATQKTHLMQHLWLNKSLDVFVNVLRSIPFIILLVAIIPFTRFIVGTSIGTTAAIVPLALCALPFVARVVESALSELGSGLIEAALAMGATNKQIIVRVLLPEALPAIINGITLMLITLVGYSAMAGAVGGGGLGDVAIRYGYQRFEGNVMLVTVLILVLMVQLIQISGNYFARRTAKGF
ncbi:MAG TPA: methionine ABC transporter permease [Coxiellaceae bacterium]|nr:methionine ABC transporter permease [Coxiellaceae bacterium]